LRTVYWILATIFVIAALTVPRLRPFAIVGCVVLAGLLAWGMVHRWFGNEPGTGQEVQQRGRPTSPAEQVHSVPLTDVSVENLALTGGGAPFELRGRIENRSKDLRLRSVTVQITRRDCYEGALDPSGCALQWQDRHWVTVTVPPREARDFATSIWMRGAAPRPRGKTQDTFEIVAATGSPGGEVEVSEE
jgi:hypothetical protein